MGRKRGVFFRKDEMTRFGHRIAIVGLFMAGVSSLWGQVDFFDLRPIRYSESSSNDVLAKLWEKEEVRAEFAGLPSGKEALRFVLEKLEVPVESQMLVFSKTSLQTKLIAPKVPRAIYFSENAYVGWVPGGMIEVIVMDRDLGPVFYAIRVPGSGGEVGIERANSCLQCHATSRTEGVPGMFVRSVAPNPDGFAILPAGTSLTTHASPLRERWGGWYVTGASDDPHLGNRIVTEEEVAEEGFEAEPARPLADLSALIDTDRYLLPTSDVVALMVLEHQCRMHNLLTKAKMSYERAWYLQSALNAEARRDDPEGLAWRTGRSNVEDILEEMLFCEEVELGGDGVQGGDDFSEVFEAGAPLSTEGRSLRELRLYKRMFQYRCSYMIYSEAFKGLPQTIKSQVLKRLREILLGDEVEEKYAHLKKSERERIAVILRETLPDLPEDW